VYNTRPPRAETTPFVVFSLASGGETNEIAQRVDELLRDFVVTAGDWASFWFRRDTIVKYVEEAPGGREVWHVGAHYVLRVAETN